MRVTNKILVYFYWSFIFCLFILISWVTEHITKISKKSQIYYSVILFLLV